MPICAPGCAVAGIPEVAGPGRPFCTAPGEETVGASNPGAEDGCPWPGAGLAAIVPVGQLLLALTHRRLALRWVVRA